MKPVGAFAETSKAYASASPPPSVPINNEGCPKTQRAIKQEICGEPPDVLLIVEEYGQNPEEQLTETEKQKNKNRKAPACANSLWAHKNGLHHGFSERFIRCRTATLGLPRGHQSITLVSERSIEPLRDNSRIVANPGNYAVVGEKSPLRSLTEL